MFFTLFMVSFSLRALRVLRGEHQPEDFPSKLGQAIR